MIEVTAAPAIPEDFLALILDHVKVETGDEEDAFGDLVEAYAEAAIARVEAMSGRMLFTRTLRLTVDAFGTALELPASPVESVTSVTYTDADGASQTLAGAAYALVERTETPKLYPAFGTTWPTVRDFPGSIVVVFLAGYGDETADVPAPLRQAVLQTVADWMRFGGSVTMTATSELPESAFRACLPFRREWA